MLKLQSSQFILPKEEGTTGDDACDFSILDNSTLVSVLCDGVGSARKGGAAARQSVKFFIDHFNVDEGGFSTNLVQLDLGFDFTPDLSLSYNIQYDDVSKVIGTNTRFRWINWVSDNTVSASHCRNYRANRQ